MSPQSPPAILNDFACRLLPLRERLQRVPAGPSTELAEARSLLESLEAEAEVLGRSALAEIIRRLVLLLEVWECLMFEGSDSAADVAAFCDRALAHLIEMSGEAEAMTDWSWILEESSASWADYLDLLDPSGTLAPHPAAEESHRSPSFLEDDPPSIAPATLLRLLAGDAGEVPSASRPVSFSMVDRNWEGEAPAEPGPSPQPAAGSAGASPSRREGNGPASLSIEIPPPPTHLELDAEMREVFLAEVTDLFERVETLVLGLGREGDPAEALHELGRCFHTLKGAAGSVGLVELSSLIHLLESQLEAAGSTVSPGLLDLLHTSLGYLEGVLAALRQGGTAPRSATVVEAPRRLPEATSGPLARAPKADEARAAPEAPAPASAATPIDGSIRIPSSRIEELMDIASELIGRRGLWTTQAVRMKEFAGMARACRSRLMGCLDRLHAIGLPRDSEEESRLMPESGAELSELVRRLSEQADDLAVLTEFAQAATLPLADNGDSLARLSIQLWDALQAIQIVPIRGLFHRLVRVAREAAQVEGREVEVETVGEETGLDRALQDKAFEPLLHVVRNAVGHGIEPAADRVRGGKPAQGRVTLEARREGNTLVLIVHDDGRGLDYNAITEKGRRLGMIAPREEPGLDRLNALIFHPGFSTRQEANTISGRGIGMDVVAREVGRLHGTIELASRPGRGASVTIRLPARLALEQAMIVRVAGQAFAVPLSAIELARSIEDGERTDGADATILVRDARIRLVTAREAIGVANHTAPPCPKLLLVRTEEEAIALLVDTIEGTRELVVKPLNPLLAGHPSIAGTSLSLSGEVILVVNPSGLARSRRVGRRPDAATQEVAAPPRPRSILVVDDSISVRRVVARHLRALGLEVEEVSDGLEALGKLRTRSYSMLLTDLEMPRMGGFELLAELGRTRGPKWVPVVVSSSKCDPETRRRALEQGARAFIAKPVEPHELARTVGKLIQEQVCVGPAVPAENQPGREQVRPAQPALRE